MYRFWRDCGYVAGGLIAGTVADALGYGRAIALVAGLTAASGLWVLVDMPPGTAAVGSSVPRHAPVQPGPTIRDMPPR